MAKKRNVNQLTLLFNPNVDFEYEVFNTIKTLPTGYKSQLFLKLLDEKFGNSKDLDKDVRNYMGLRNISKIKQEQSNSDSKMIESEPVEISLPEIKLQETPQPPQNKKPPLLKNPSF